MLQRALIEKVKQDPKLMHALHIAQPIFDPVRIPWCICGGVWLDQGEIKVYECSSTGLQDLLERIVRFNPMSGNTQEQFNKFCLDRNLTGVV